MVWSPGSILKKEVSLGTTAVLFLLLLLQRASHYHPLRGPSRSRSRSRSRRNKERTAESDDTRQRFAMLGNSWLFGIGRRFPHENAIMAFFNLVQCPGIIVSRYELFSFSMICSPHSVYGMGWEN